MAWATPNGCTAVVKFGMTRKRPICTLKCKPTCRTRQLQPLPKGTCSCCGSSCTLSRVLQGRCMRPSRNSSSWSFRNLSKRSAVPNTRRVRRTPVAVLASSSVLRPYIYYRRISAGWCDCGPVQIELEYDVEFGIFNSGFWYHVSIANGDQSEYIHWHGG